MQYHAKVAFTTLAAVSIIYFAYDLPLTVRQINSISVSNYIFTREPRRNDLCDNFNNSKTVWILETKDSWIKARNLCTVEAAARQMPHYCVRFVRKSC